jgi:carbon storage regulator
VIPRGKPYTLEGSRSGVGCLLPDPSLAMLVLSRKQEESIVIGENIVVTVVEIRGDKVRLGITAPREVTVHRREVYDKVKESQRAPRPAPDSGPEA